MTYDAPAGLHRVTLSLPSLIVSSGTYYAQVRLWDAQACKLLAESPYKFTLQVEDQGKATGMIALPHEWSALTSLTPVAGELVAAG